ncbi:hypothetical protein C5167_014503 [Papaver somniferum]|uniref:Uncharacterized protein n=1 Tax=Papaver somniferum TaxID=3469 RepID=A0A4Y7J7P4_PAPSO|nr:hypothetical protein C5167_014503 [Papaver somniferum]
MKKFCCCHGSKKSELKSWVLQLQSRTGSNLKKKMRSEMNLVMLGFVASGTAVGDGIYTKAEILILLGSAGEVQELSQDGDGVDAWKNIAFLLQHRSAGFVFSGGLRLK